jgi:hypothetical protein
LRLGKQAAELLVRQLGKRLLAGARSVRAEPGNTNGPVIAGAGDKQEPEFVVLVLRDVAGRNTRQDLPSMLIVRVGMLRTTPVR